MCEGWGQNCVCVCAYVCTVVVWVSMHEGRGQKSVCVRVCVCVCISMYEDCGSGGQGLFAVVCEERLSPFSLLSVT